MQEEIAWKYSSTLALPLTYSSKLLLMLLSICSPDNCAIGAVVGVVIFAEVILLGILERGTTIFAGPIVADETPMGGNIGAGVDRCDDEANNVSFEDLC